MALHRLFPTPEIFNRPILKDKNFRILSKIAVFHCFLSKTDKDGLRGCLKIFKQPLKQRQRDK